MAFISCSNKSVSVVLTFFKCERHCCQKNLSEIKFWLFHKIKLSEIKVGLYMYYIYFTDKHFQPYWNRVLVLYFFKAIRFWAPSWTAGAPFDEDAQGQHCFVQSHREWRHRSRYIRICTNKIIYFNKQLHVLKISIL